MDDIAEVYPELNIPGSAPNDVYSKVMGPDTHGIVRTLGKGAAPSLVYGPVYKRAQAEKRDFDARVELEVQKATSAMKIEMAEKLAEAQKEMKAMDKKLSEAKEEAKKDKEAVERKLSEAKIDMEVIITDKVKAGVQAYLESLCITIDVNTKSGQISDNSIEDRQQPLSPISFVHTKKVRGNKVLIFISICLNHKIHMISGSADSFSCFYFLFLFGINRPTINHYVM
ncbi:hypothetical protein T459_19257 [Capsicum annuum]|uniref:Uncharacterized protein n=1 Tax=Capsicum annuum TaxID=4072 RepID=A0A2G2Z1J7_CAPAN|nr:hypothetical protein T459_19257 [Capsicum annuum]